MNRILITPLRRGNNHFVEVAGPVDVLRQIFDQLELDQPVMVARSMLLRCTSREKAIELSNRIKQVATQIFPELLPSNAPPPQSQERSPASQSIPPPRKPPSFETRVWQLPQGDFCVALSGKDAELMATHPAMWAGFRTEDGGKTFLYNCISQEQAAYLIEQCQEVEKEIEWGRSQEEWLS